MKVVQRNHNIDLLKIVLSFFVVAAHVLPSTNVYGFEGGIFYGIQGLARLTVPFFFIISGYFLRNHLHNKANMYKYGKRIFILFVVWQIIYAPLLIKFYKAGAFDTQQLLSNIVYGTGHLWYLIASVGGVALLYLSRNLKIPAKFILAITLILVGYYYQFLFDAGKLTNNGLLTNFYLLIGTCRNFLFYAFPYIMLGTLYENWKNLAKKFLWLLLPLFICIFIETNYYVNFPVPILNIYLTSLPLCLLLLYWIVESKKQIQINVKPNISLGIYLCHFYAVYYLYDVFPATTFGMIWIKYFLICFISVILWYIVDKINSKFPYFF